MKKFIFLLFFVFSIWGFYNFSLWYLTDGFSLSKIKINDLEIKQWRTPRPEKDNYTKILQQNFFYAGRGSQCYVFESEDKQYVLKFLRLNRYTVSKFLKYTAYPSFLFDLYTQKKEEKEKKFNALCSSCLIAFEEMPEETGVIFVHLNKTTYLKNTVVIYDKIKRPHTVALDECCFIIQKRGEHIFNYLTHLLEKRKLKEAQSALNNLTELIASRLQKGIVDHDAVIHKNSGFQGERAFFIDIGEFSKAPTEDFHQELLATTQELRSWLAKKEPLLAHYFDTLLESYQTTR